MNLFNIVCWIGNVFYLVGVYLVAKKRVSGLVCNCVGCICYCISGFIIDSYAIIFLDVILFFLNIYGIYEWRKND